MTATADSPASAVRRLRPLHKAPAVTAVLIAVVLTLGGCRPLYVPLVPDDAQAPPAAVRLTDVSHLSVVAGRPRLVVSLAIIGPDAGGTEGGWLAVQWFGPAGGQAASESVWVAGRTGDEPVTFDLPADVTVVPGEWRAVVSMGGVLLRQFRADVVAGPED